MLPKRIALFIYYILVITVFANTVQLNDFDIGASQIFFGVLFPCFTFWLIHMWLIKADKETAGTWVYWVNWFFYLTCFTSGVVVLIKIYLEPSSAVMWFISLPFIQGFFYLMSVAIMAHITIFSNSHNKSVK